MTPFKALQRGRREAADRYELAGLRLVLSQAGWSTREAARLLGCSESTLRRALARHPDLELERGQLGPSQGWPKYAKNNGKK